MHGYWLTLYDGTGRRLGRPWWYDTLSEAEHEAQEAMRDSEKVREALIWRKKEDGWEKVREVRRSDDGCCVHTRVNGGLEGFFTRLVQEEGRLMSENKVFPTARYRGSQVHAVNATGGPEDGSLYGMFTLCGRQILNLLSWRETPNARLTCKNCIRAFRPEDYPIRDSLLNRQREP